MNDYRRFHIEITNLEDFAAFVAILRNEATNPETLTQLAALVKTAQDNTASEERNVDKLKGALPT